MMNLQNKDDKSTITVKPRIEALAQLEALAQIEAQGYG